MLRVPLVDIRRGSAKKRLLLHIGAHKTGSTAIQRFSCIATALRWPPTAFYTQRLPVLARVTMDCRIPCEAK